MENIELAIYDEMIQLKDFPLNGIGGIIKEAKSKGVFLNKDLEKIVLDFGHDRTVAKDLGVKYDSEYPCLVEAAAYNYISRNP